MHRMAPICATARTRGPDRPAAARRHRAGPPAAQRSAAQRSVEELVDLEHLAREARASEGPVWCMDVRDCGVQATVRVRGVYLGSGVAPCSAAVPPQRVVPVGFFPRRASWRVESGNGRAEQR